MPWETPSLSDVRKRNRDYIIARMKVALVPNSVTRFVADAGAGLAHLNLQRLDWLALQLMADTAETEWLDRMGNIWLVNADGSKGRKAPVAASGYVTCTGIAGSVIPMATELRGGIGSVVSYQTTADVVMGDAATSVPVLAIDAGTAGNMEQGDYIAFVTDVEGVEGTATVTSLSGGTEQEDDDDLRLRVLERIRKPPMGGDADDYVQWALAYPGVTRAWCSPKELGIGTVTVRFLMDDLREKTGGFPGVEDVANVQSWIDKLRPVTALDTYVVAPLPEPISFTLTNLEPDDSSTMEAIAESVKDMLHEKAAPAYALNGIAQDAQTIYAAWVSDAVMRTSGVKYFDLTMSDHAMPSKGHVAVLGTIGLG